MAQSNAVEAPKTPAQMYALIGGGFLLALGVLALIIEGLSFGTVSSTGSQEFILWGTNGWTTILWIAFGAAGLAMMSRVDASRAYALVAGAVFTAMAVWGFIDGNSVVSLFVADTTNNITHAILGVAGLIVGIPTERQQREAGVATSPEEQQARFNRTPEGAPPERARARSGSGRSGSSQAELPQRAGAQHTAPPKLGRRRLVRAAALGGHALGTQ